MKINTPVTTIEREFPLGKYIVSRTDLKGIITYADDTFVDVSGFSREELLGKNHNIVRHPDMPPAAFAWAWDTLKADRPWRGLVKNRCKNGDFYWVDALIVPVLQAGEKIGYMSVRTRPERAAIVAAEALYKKLQAGQASTPKASRWAQLPLRGKLQALVVGMITAQLLAVGAESFGAQLGIPTGTLNTLVTLLSAGGIAAALALLLLQNRLMTIVGRITGRLQHIAQGDLTDDIPLHRVDELGRLNDALVTMQTHLRAMLAEIAEQSGTVDTHIQALGGDIEDTRRATSAQSNAAQRIAASVEQLVSAVDQIAGDAQQAAQAVATSHTLLTAASEGMQQSQTAADHVVHTVHDAGRSMDALFHSISAIERVSQVIREIADQTNLLALNAAIEAARAGESGRGFAVVADEVRKLAENSSKQTSEISSSIQRIQSSTQAALSTMTVAGTQVDAVNQTAKSARTGLDTVAAQGTTIGQLADHIAHRTRQQATAGSDIALQMEDILSGISQTSSTIEEVTARSTRIQEATARLRELVTYFRFIR
ncbi:methyl-accepting chemotaxis protein [Azonexus sp.]|uniref:methyl-accepting chemotaxis protein n=1 Tax=Azonexus sp. TaxID=1872668 RepID=UPI0039E5378E